MILEDLSKRDRRLIITRAYPAVCTKWLFPKYDRDSWSKLIEIVVSFFSLLI
ncbi:hypothetical protein EMIT07CA2_20004 [Brevibacillus sp. IT-7CA2]